MRRLPFTLCLDVQRREVLVTLVGAAVLGPAGAAHALSHGIQNRQGSHTHGSTWFFDEQIENVKEDFLSLLLIGQKLDVIHNEYINLLIKIDKILNGVVLDILDNLIGKFL